MTDPNPYNPFVERPGVSTIKPKKNAAIERRIEAIGALADRHKECLGRRDYRGLIELSYDYDRQKYMHNTAAMLRSEAALIQKKKEKPCTQKSG